MYNYFSRIVLLGDDSRYLFLRSILPENLKINLSMEKLQSNYIRLIYAKNNYFEEYDDNNVIEIALNIIPVSKLIELPQDFYKLYGNDNKINKLVIFNSFPYGKLNLIETYEQALRNFNIIESEFVLYKEQRRFGITDLVSEDDSIKDALYFYSSKNIKTKVYDSSSNINEIFELKPNFINYFKISYKNRLIMTKEKLNNYESYYDFYIKDYYNSFTPLNPESNEEFNRIFSFRKIRNSNDIWLSFTKAFKKEYLKDEYGLLGQLRTFYSEAIEEISIWDKDEDLNNFDNHIFMVYDEFFKDHIVLRASDNELEYIKKINYDDNKNLEVLFKKRLSEFVNFKLKIEIYNYIQNKIKFIANEIGE